MIKATTRRASAPRALQPGEPWADDGSSNGRFVGWVLVQVWDQGARGTGVSLHSSGPTEPVLRAASEGLTRLARGT